jgi:hypothetical protein
MPEGRGFRGGISMTISYSQDRVDELRRSDPHGLSSTWELERQSTLENLEKVVANTEMPDDLWEILETIVSFLSV